MSRPKRPNAPNLFDARPTSSNDGLWTVSELNARIKGILEGDFGDIGLRGEISNLSRPGSGHLYFSLKDGDSQIRAVLWRAAAQRLVFALENGLDVRLWGGVTVYEPRGEYQLIVRKIEPAGLGALELAFRQLYDRLRAEGLFDDDRKRPLPRFPKRIVVISSPSGDAVRDVIRIVGDRWPLAELLIAPSRVQGEGASVELAAALALANRVADADLVILARGGGSIEDLWAFNEEILVRAIVGSRVPVVSAVGHERDVTLADHAADLRAPTPTAAALLTTPDIEELAQTLDLLGGRMARRLRAVVERVCTRLDGLGQRAELACRRGLEQRRGRLQTLDLRLKTTARRTFDGHRATLSRAAAQLESLSPLGVLSRGYSLTQSADTGCVVRDASTLAAGDRVRTRLAQGGFLSRVEQVDSSTLFEDRPK